MGAQNEGEQIRRKSMDEKYITLTIGKQKNIALIAHDNKKADLIAWCEENKEILKITFCVGQEPQRV